LIFGRSATDGEVKAGLAFLTTEPMKTYQERKTTKLAKDDTKDTKTHSASEDDLAVEKPDKDDVGMMAGVMPGTSKADEKKLLPPTPWGRYVKILLSSSEFLFID